MKPTRKKHALVITTRDDILGHTETFHLPDAALYYGTGHTTIREEMKMETTRERLCIRAFTDFDRSDVLIHDLDDKIKLVRRLRRSGAWL